MIWYSFVEILKLVYFGMVWYDLVWFGQNSEAEFNTVSESLTKVGIELLGQLKKWKVEGSTRSSTQNHLHCMNNWHLHMKDRTDYHHRHHRHHRHHPHPHHPHHPHRRHDNRHHHRRHRLKLGLICISVHCTGSNIQMATAPEAIFGQNYPTFFCDLIFSSITAMTWKLIIDFIKLKNSNTVKSPCHIVIYWRFNKAEILWTS